MKPIYKWCTGRVAKVVADHCDFVFPGPILEVSLQYTHFSTFQIIANSASPYTVLHDQAGGIIFIDAKLMCRRRNQDIQRARDQTYIITSLLGLV